MDVLSAVMGELHLSRAGYRRLELTAPWAIGFDQQGLRGVHIVLEGRCEAQFRGEPALPLAAGDLVIAPRADPHVLRSPGAEGCAAIPAAALVTGTVGGGIAAGGGGDRAVVLCGAFSFEENRHWALSGLPHVVKVSGTGGELAPWLKGHVDVLLAEALDPGPGSEAVLAQLSAAVVTRALRDSAAAAAHPGWLLGLTDPAVSRALGAIHDEAARCWTVDALARSVGLSRAVFAARFRQLVGETPMRYLAGRRMHRAARLLGDGHTLAQAAEATGYGSEAAFSAAFKRHVGTTPGQVRKRPMASPAAPRCEG